MSAGYWAGMLPSSLLPPPLLRRRRTRRPLRRRRRREDQGEAAHPMPSLPVQGHVYWTHVTRDIQRGGQIDRVHPNT